MKDRTMNLLTLTFPDHARESRPAFHCPACGVRSLGGESPELLVCEHLLFVYLREIGAFLHHDEPFKATFDVLRARMIRELTELQGEPGIEPAWSRSDTDAPEPDSSELDEESSPLKVRNQDVVEEFLRQVARQGTTIFGVQLTTGEREGGARPSTLLLGYCLAGEPTRALEAIRRESSEGLD